MLLARVGCQANVLCLKSKKMAINARMMGHFNLMFCNYIWVLVSDVVGNLKETCLAENILWRTLRLVHHCHWFVFNKIADYCGFMLCNWVCLTMLQTFLTWHAAVVIITSLLSFRDVALRTFVRYCVIGKILQMQLWYHITCTYRS